MPTRVTSSLLSVSLGLLVLLGCSPAGPNKVEGTDLPDSSKFHVIEILDGDSVLVRGVNLPHLEASIDLLGVSADSRSDEAETYLRENVLNRDVHIEGNLHSEDRPGGVTSDDYAYIFLVEDDRMVNIEMLRLGLVELDDRKGKPVRYRKEFEDVSGD